MVFGGAAGRTYIPWLVLPALTLAQNTTLPLVLGTRAGPKVANVPPPESGADSPCWASLIRGRPGPTVGTNAAENSDVLPSAEVAVAVKVTYGGKPLTVSVQFPDESGVAEPT